jgi:SAM-dependent methyltransferase
VNPTIVSRLLDINRQFYQSFAVPFSETRQRLQPGVFRILKMVEPEAMILDLGCGNGELARTLSRMGHRGLYIGVDSSAGLLSLARANTSEDFPATFIQVDLSVPGWERSVPQSNFDFVFAFAVLHHLPGSTLRRQLLRKIPGLLTAGGSFIHSEWQFLNSERLRARLQPWREAGLDASDVDPGDYLLDWRQGGYSLRYVHHFTIEELEELAQETCFQIQETFHSDGESGDLGLYQVWKPIGV